MELSETSFGWPSPRRKEVNGALAEQDPWWARVKVPSSKRVLSGKSFTPARSGPGKMEEYRDRAAPGRS